MIKSHLRIYLVIITFLNNAQLAESQEIGYVTGVNKIGINPNSFQPIYGFTIGSKLNKYFYIETSMFYSQRSKGSIIQADYLSFIAFPEVGYFENKWGVFYSPAISLNPTLYHSNIKNHTYLSSIQTIGGQINLGKKIIANLKLGYDYGLTGAYYENNTYQRYNGPVVFLGLKCQFNN